MPGKGNTEPLRVNVTIRRLSREESENDPDPSIRAMAYRQREFWGWMCKAVAGDGEIVLSKEAETV